jgi:hypothetical protein
MVGAGSTGKLTAYGIGDVASCVVLALHLPGVTGADGPGT